MRLLILIPLLGCPTGPADDDSTTDVGELDTVTSTDRPSKRSEIKAVADPESDSVVIFGGNDAPIVDQIPRSAFRDDTWTFQPGVGWTEVTGEGPSARGRYGAVLDPVGGRALLFGGRFRDADQTGDYTLLGDLWAFDFTARTWERLDDGGNGGPSRRYLPQLAWSAVDDALYLWGGVTSSNALSYTISEELWRWAPDGGWGELDTSGDAPSTRTFVGSVQDPATNRLHVFAGQRGDFQSLAYNDLFALDLGTGEWEEIDGGGGDAPFTRMYPHLLWDDARDRLLMFGGHTDIGDGNDLWAWTDRWELVYEADVFTGEALGCLGNPAEVPADYVEQDLSAPERRQKAMAVILRDNLWIFGGMHAECSEHLDDTWRFDLAEEQWHEVIEARTGESCLRRQDDCECLCI
jgi:hypothetical protein